ncbi:MAG: VWA domain-containing protein [Acidobacteriota bacterium]
MHRSILVLSVCAALAVPALAQRADESAQPTKKRDPRDLPIETELVEEVAVELAEVSVLVTDRRGNAITDLKLEEITVFEGGKRQRLAYLDNVGGTRFAGKADDTPPPAAVYDRQGTMVDAGDIDAVMPARAIRRVVLAFDVKNSKLNIREKWRQAAEDWVRDEMRDDDLVGVVVFRSYPFWLIQLTHDKLAVLHSIEAVSLDQGMQDRDKGRDVSQLVEDIHSLCTDLGRPSDRRSRGSGRTGSPTPGSDEAGCAYNLAEPQVQQWDLEANETLDTLRGLTGQLAAVPGRKMVILFSEGWVSDAATAGTQAMVAVFGVGKIDTSVVRWSLERDALREVNLLQLAAKAAKVSFFTIDTTRRNDGGFGSNLERGQALAYQNQGINPWSEMNWETRQTLNALAKATGGRSYHGTKDLDEKMTAAADSFFGYYLVGYYRSDPRAPAGKVKVKIDRDKLDIGYPDKPTLWPHKASPVRLDLSVGQPVLAMDGVAQAVPLKFTMNLADLPLRRGAGGRGAQLGVYVQAVRPDGTVVAERLDITTVVLDREGRRAHLMQSYEHTTELILPEGPYRIRARISDDRQKIISERVLDLTVKAGAVVAGFEPAPADAD